MKTKVSRLIDYTLFYILALIVAFFIAVCVHPDGDEIVREFLGY